MSKQSKKKAAVFFGVCLVLFLVLSLLTGHPGGHGESIQELMKDAVLHESNHISLFGLIEVNPALISAYVVTGVLLVFALIVRLTVIPKFKRIPGKFQMLLESWVGLFDNMAKSYSPHMNGALGPYIFAAGTYIFVSTIFELFGLQAVSTHGLSIALPAPLADINAAIAMGVTSYLFILSGGIMGNGIKGVGSTLKEFSLPISMSFRLFGALLSGLLVTELVYYTIYLSFVLPVLVAVLFTLIHAIVQTYVLTMLTATFYGEVSEKGEHEEKKANNKKTNEKNTQATA